MTDAMSDHERRQMWKDQGRCPECGNPEIGKETREISRIETTFKVCLDNDCGWGFDHE